MKQTNLRKSDIILHTLNPYDPEMQRTFPSLKESSN